MGLGCLYLLCSYSFCLFSLITLSISLSAERFSISYSFCFFSLISLSISLSAERFSCCIILICSFLCSAVLGFLCKNGRLFLISAIKSLGNFLILLTKHFSILFSSPVLNFGILSSISFFSTE